MGQGYGGIPEQPPTGARMLQPSTTDVARRHVSDSCFVAYMRWPSGPYRLQALHSHKLRLGKRRHLPTESGFCTPESIFAVHFTPRNSAAHRQEQGECSHQGAASPYSYETPPRRQEQRSRANHHRGWGSIREVRTLYQEAVFPLLACGVGELAIRPESPNSLWAAVSPLGKEGNFKPNQASAHPRIHSECVSTIRHPLYPSRLTGALGSRGSARL